MQLRQPAPQPDSASKKPSSDMKFNAVSEAKTTQSPKQKQQLSKLTAAKTVGHLATDTVWSN